MADQRSSREPGALRRAAAEELRVLLARRKISATTLARMAGMKQPYLSRRMTGEVPFDLDDLETIGKALELDPVELLASAYAVSEVRESRKITLWYPFRAGQKVRKITSLTGRPSRPEGPSVRMIGIPSQRTSAA